MSPDSPNVLIVEDELTAVFAMREFFTSAGYRVDCAAGLLDVMTLLERGHYDVIITDLHLSQTQRGEGMTVVVCARLRNPRARIIMLTGFASETSEREARRRGADLYQTKPIALLDLAALVEAGENGVPPAGRAEQGADPR